MSTSFVRWIAPLLLAACAARARPALTPVAMPSAAPRAVEPSAALSATPAPRAEPSGFHDVNTDNSLVTNGSVTATADPLLATAAGFRREVYRLGGRVISEQLHYRAFDLATGEIPGARYRVKILPRVLPDLLDWLGSHSAITAEDVSSIVAMESEADAAIVRDDVRARLSDIDAALGDAHLSPEEHAAYLRERQQLAGDALPDSTAMAGNTMRVAVLDVHLDAPRAADPLAHGAMLARARLSTIGLGVLARGASMRFGGGVAIGGRGPVPALEVDGYAADGTMSHAGMMATLGIGAYSKALGAGQRPSWNPYVGAHVGYAYFDGSYLAVAGELGVEVFKKSGVVWTISGRPIGLFGDHVKAAVEVGTAIGLAF